MLLWVNPVHDPAGQSTAKLGFVSVNFIGRLVPRLNVQRELLCSRDGDSDCRCDVPANAPHAGGPRMTPSCLSRREVATNG